MGKVLCIYHANCADGLGAAWAVQKALGPEVEFVAAKYGQEAPSCTDRDVLIVDFSYPLPVLGAMAQEARSVLVLDHHKTAQEDLAELPEPDRMFYNWQKDTLPFNLAAIFDLNHSGAGLTWDYLHPGTPRPRIIDLIEDRDLWKFAHGGESRAFHAVLASYDWSDLSRMCTMLDAWADWYDVENNQPDCMAWINLIDEGYAILRAQQQAVRTAVESSRRTMKIAGHVVPVANVPSSMASDAGHLLCQEFIDSANAETELPKEFVQEVTKLFFSATYYDGADGKRHFSLRSPEGGADVGQIAKRMAAEFNERARNISLGNVEHQPSGWIFDTPWAGGGHLHAAGFDAPLGWEEQ